MKKSISTADIYRRIANRGKAPLKLVNNSGNTLAELEAEVAKLESNRAKFAKGGEAKKEQSKQTHALTFGERRALEEAKGKKPQELKGGRRPDGTAETLEEMIEDDEAQVALCDQQAALLTEDLKQVQSVLTEVSNECNKLSDLDFELNDPNPGITTAIKVLNVATAVGFAVATGGSSFSMLSPITSLGSLTTAQAIASVGQYMLHSAATSSALSGATDVVISNLMQVNKGDIKAALNEYQGAVSALHELENEVRRNFNSVKIQQEYNNRVSSIQSQFYANANAIKEEFKHNIAVGQQKMNALVTEFHDKKERTMEILNLQHQLQETKIETQGVGILVSAAHEQHLSRAKEAAIEAKIKALASGDSNAKNMYIPPSTTSAQTMGKILFNVGGAGTVPPTGNPILQSLAQELEQANAAIQQKIEQDKIAVQEKLKAAQQQAQALAEQEKVAAQAKLEEGQRKIREAQEAVFTKEQERKQIQQLEPIHTEFRQKIKECLDAQINASKELDKKQTEIIAEKEDLDRKKEEIYGHMVELQEKIKERDAEIARKAAEEAARLETIRLQEEENERARLQTLAYQEEENERARLQTLAYQEEENERARLQTLAYQEEENERANIQNTQDSSSSSIPTDMAPNLLYANDTPYIMYSPPQGIIVSYDNDDGNYGLSYLNNNVTTEDLLNCDPSTRDPNTVYSVSLSRFLNAEEERKYHKFNGRIYGFISPDLHAEFTKHAAYLAANSKPFNIGESWQGANVRNQQISSNSDQPPKQVEPIVPKQVEPIVPKQVEPIVPKQVEPVAPRYADPSNSNLAAINQPSKTELNAISAQIKEQPRYAKEQPAAEVPVDANYVAELNELNELLKHEEAKIANQNEINNLQNQIRDLEILEFMAQANVPVDIKPIPPEKGEISYLFELPEMSGTEVEKEEQIFEIKADIKEIEQMVNEIKYLENKVESLPEGSPERAEAEQKVEAAKAAYEEKQRKLLIEKGDEVSGKTKELEKALGADNVEEDELVELPTEIEDSAIIKDLKKVQELDAVESKTRKEKWAMEDLQKALQNIKKEIVNPLFKEKENSLSTAIKEKEKRITELNSVISSLPREIIIPGHFQAPQMLEPERVEPDPEYAKQLAEVERYSKLQHILDPNFIQNMLGGNNQIYINNLQKLKNDLANMSEHKVIPAVWDEGINIPEKTEPNPEYIEKTKEFEQLHNEQKDLVSNLEQIQKTGKIILPHGGEILRSIPNQEYEETKQKLEQAEKEYVEVTNKAIANLKNEELQESIRAREEEYTGGIDVGGGEYVPSFSNSLGAQAALLQIIIEEEEKKVRDAAQKKFQDDNRIQAGNLVAPKLSDFEQKRVDLKALKSKFSLITDPEARNKTLEEIRAKQAEYNELEAKEAQKKLAARQMMFGGIPPEERERRRKEKEDILTQKLADSKRREEQNAAEALRNFLNTAPQDEIDKYYADLEKAQQKQNVIPTETSTVREQQQKLAEREQRRKAAEEAELQAWYTDPANAEAVAKLEAQKRQKEEEDEFYARPENKNLERPKHQLVIAPDNFSDDPEIRAQQIAQKAENEKRIALLAGTKLQGSSSDFFLKQIENEIKAEAEKRGKTPILPELEEEEVIPNIGDLERLANIKDLENQLRNTSEEERALYRQLTKTKTVASNSIENNAKQSAARLEDRKNRATNITDPNYELYEEDIKEVLGSQELPDNVGKETIVAQNMDSPLGQEVLQDSIVNALNMLDQGKDTMLISANLGRSHWVSMMIKKDLEGNIKVVHNDPVGSPMSPFIRGGLESVGIPDENIADLQIQQQTRNPLTGSVLDVNCGIIVADNLLRMVKGEPLMDLTEASNNAHNLRQEAAALILSKIPEEEAKVAEAQKAYESLMNDPSAIPNTGVVQSDEALWRAKAEEKTRLENELNQLRSAKIPLTNAEKIRDMFPFAPKDELGRVFTEEEKRANAQKEFERLERELKAVPVTGEKIDFDEFKNDTATLEHLKKIGLNVHSKLKPGVDQNKQKPEDTINTYSGIDAPGSQEAISKQAIFKKMILKDQYNKQLKGLEAEKFMGPHPDLPEGLTENDVFEEITRFNAANPRERLVHFSKQDKDPFYAAKVVQDYYPKKHEAIENPEVAARINEKHNPKTYQRNIEAIARLNRFEKDIDFLLGGTGRQYDKAEVLHKYEMPPAQAPVSGGQYGYNTPGGRNLMKHYAKKYSGRQDNAIFGNKSAFSGNYGPPMSSPFGSKNYANPLEYLSNDKFNPYTYSPSTVH